MFATYADRQSVHEVAKKYGVSHRTVERYRRLERWDERAAEIREEARRAADYSIAEAMADSLRLVRSFKAKLAEAVEAKTITGADVSVLDVEKIVRLEAFILGAAETRHEIVTTFSDWTEAELAEFAETGRRPTRARSGTPRT